jgi:cytoskeletal protein RodZ
VYLILALLLTTFWVYSIVDCAIQPPQRHRGVSKPVWMLIVILVPVLGGILWFAVGRTRRRAMNPTFRAPDDNPEFLGRIGTISDQDERIRRLEEELAALDSEADDPLPPQRQTPSAPGAAEASDASESDAAPGDPAAGDDPGEQAGPRGTHG